MGWRRLISWACGLGKLVTTGGFKFRYPLWVRIPPSPPFSLQGCSVDGLHAGLKIQKLWLDPIRPYHFVRHTLHSVRPPFARVEDPDHLCWTPFAHAVIGRGDCASNAGNARTPRRCGFNSYRVRHFQSNRKSPGIRRRGQVVTYLPRVSPAL